MPKAIKDKRLVRISINILILTFLAALAVTGLQSQRIDLAGVLCGGGLGFVYFVLLARTISQALAGAVDSNDLESNAAGRLGIKLFAYTFAMALITIGLILTKICRPIGFLAGFTALPLSIGFEALIFAAFDKPAGDRENKEKETDDKKDQG